ncbi:MAG: cupredoxin domain-containing protein [Acidiferrobacterales bacterium]
MNKFFGVAIVLMAGMLVLAGTPAISGQDMSQMPGMTSRANGAHNRGSFTFGRPGDPGKVDRTFQIKALDTMRYNQSEFTVRAGETVRFIVTNAGKMRHEFVIGDAAEQREHAKEMAAMPGMAMPDEANGISLAPGETKSIVWQFARPGTVELACHEPGHYEAGMVSRVIVSK